MKKIAKTIAVLLAGLASGACDCEHSNRIQEVDSSSGYYIQPRKNTKKYMSDYPEEIYSLLLCREFQYKGHDMVAIKIDDYSSWTMLHDPECRKCQGSQLGEQNSELDIFNYSLWND